jgi:hypothetical protein
MLSTEVIGLLLGHLAVTAFIIIFDEPNEAQGLSERRAVPFGSISSNSAFAIRRRCRASRRGRKVTGGPGVVRM